MSKFDDIKEHLSNAFPKFSDVLQIELRSEFSVTDDGGQSFIILSIQFENNTFTIMMNGVDTVKNGFDSTKLFNVSNSVMVGFIPIDGKKGLLGFGVSHCDFVFFDENDFCFVEFKLNASSREERAISKNREKAIEQLINTISLFDFKLNRNYAELNLEAYVCTPEFYPRFNASWQELAENFLEENCIPLFESNDKTCK
ncbi:MAG: hypothetical protein HCA25_04255 [Dolichospermum sp. DET50]|nr:hypothetical protein [Dolichospermum sp. DET66]MBS3031512.1 hypothetical protein [Dolichospermum sp. DET67]MBS3036724.1 hypothetical protein [Dolichospermum sp. DET50]QSX68756.1 MAG: hypothetical protein EZY12_03415 [Dolichospermum sp. DET69]